MTLVAATPEAAQAGLSHVKVCIRTNYSNPPKHGGAIVATVLGDVPSVMGASESGSMIPLITRCSASLGRSSLQFRLDSIADRSETHCEIPMPVVPELQQSNIQSVR